MSRKRFWDIFRENPDGTLTSLVPIRVNGVDFSPQVQFEPGINISGVNFHLFRNLDIAVEQEDHTLVIKGFYK